MGQPFDPVCNLSGGSGRLRRGIERQMSSSGLGGLSVGRDSLGQTQS